MAVQCQTGWCPGLESSVRLPLARASECEQHLGVLSAESTGIQTFYVCLAQYAQSEQMIQQAQA